MPPLQVRFRRFTTLNTTIRLREGNLHVSLSDVLEGAPEPVLTPSESGKGQQVWRCPDCRVALWSNYGGAVDVLRFVRVGTLDTPAALPPDVHIYTRSKLPWVSLPAGVPAFEAYYDSAALWPAASLARRAAVFAKMPTVTPPRPEGN